jgi:RNA polymerase sigma factor (TIGR02999 family)
MNCCGSFTPNCGACGSQDGAGTAWAHLQATALVHEAWLRLGDGVFANRAHFFAAASEAMRRILVERARRKHREKRGGGAEHVDVDDLEIAAPLGNEEESLAVDEALDRLAAHDARKAEVVKLRYFVGCSFEETARCLASPCRPPSAIGLTRVPGCTRRLAQVTGLCSAR